MQNLNSVRTTRTLDPLVLPQDSRVLHYSDGHCGDLGGEPSACPTNPGMVFGQWAELEIQVNACGGAKQGTELSLGPALISSLLGSHNTTLYADHYPCLDVTGLLCVPSIMLIQSILPRERRLIGNLRKLRFSADKSLSKCHG